MAGLSRRWLPVGLLAGAATGQAPALPVHELPGAAACAVGVLWDHGSGPGAAEVAPVRAALAQCRLAAARRHAPSVQVQVHLDPELLAIVGVVPAAAAGELPAFLRALLQPADGATDDDLALAVAHAALRVDDQHEVLPGGVLLRRARAALWPERPPWLGDSPTIAAVWPRRVRELLAMPARCVVAAAGNLPGELRPLLESLVPVGPPAGSHRRREGSPALAPAGLVDAEHAFVDQPFVAAAFAVAPGSDELALAVATAAVQLRAAQRWQLRGTELRARAPFVVHEWLAGDDLVAFLRRGVDFVLLLPGERAADAAAERDATRREILELIQDLRSTPLTAAEVERARSVRRTEIALAAGPAGDPSVLAARLLAAMLAAERGFTADGIDAVTPAAAQQALARLLAAEPAWHSVSPRPVPGRGFRPR